MGLNPVFFHALTGELPGATFTDGTEILWEVRGIKSAEEIESARKANRLADLCGEALAEEMKKSVVKEADLFATYWDAMYRNGGGYGWFFKAGTTQTARPSDYSCHINPYNYTIQGGDIFIAELIPAWADGYLGHLEVCFVRGELAQRTAYEKMNDVCLDCYNAVLSCLKPGAAAEEIVEKGDNPIAEAGFMRGAPLVYSIGLFSIEPPFVGLPDDPSWSEPVPLRSGMTLNVISHVYDKDTNICVRTGSTCLITDTGYECLNNTSFPRGLVHIEG
jgi:Xaa-Pro aminopeptidase